MTACAHRAADLAPQPTLDELATARAVQRVTAVDVTDECKRLTEDHPFPQDYAGKNVYVSRWEWRPTAKLQRKQLAYARTCITDTHNAYAKGLPTK